MKSNQCLEFGTPEEINSEIRRRASVMATADDAGNAENPYVVASRQMFHELLMRLAGVEKRLDDLREKPDDI